MTGCGAAVSHRCAGTVTFADRTLFVSVTGGAGDEEWHEGRSEGVTATDAATLIGARSTKIREDLLDAKLNGARFQGNKHTRRGHLYEPLLLAELVKADGVEELYPSHALFHNEANVFHRATPDGFGVHDQFGPFGAEVKHHKKPTSGIPRRHHDQMQWGMHTLGFSWWLYAWGVEGQEGIAGSEWIARDDARIAQLIATADEFIAWREAGAPAPTGLPTEIDVLVAKRARMQQESARLSREYKKLDEQIQAWALMQNPEPGKPLRIPGTSASLFFEPRPDMITFDAEAWAEGDPFTYKATLAQRQFAVQHEAEAAERFPLVKPSAPVYRVTPNAGEDRA